MERRADRTVGPLAVPATIGETLPDQPLDDGRDVDTEVSAVGHRTAVDALLDLTLPKGLVVVVPSCVGPHQLGGAARPLGGRVGPEMAQLAQSVGGCGPGLAHLFPLLEVEPGGYESTSRPLAVLVLVCEELRSPTFRLHLGPLGRPFRLGGVQQVTHHLPPDRRVRVEEPSDHRSVVSHDSSRLSAPARVTTSHWSRRPTRATARR